jgi:biotin synthase-like enzyme
MLARNRFSDCAFCAFSALEKESIRKDWRLRGPAAGLVERWDELVDRGAQPLGTGQVLEWKVFRPFDLTEASR